MEVKNEVKSLLGQFRFRPKDRFVYEYDFGDSWDHVITVEKVLEPQAGMSYPQVIAGKRACPPEDVGGIWGYANFLAVMHDKKHPEHQEMLEWIGGPFDPEEFNLEEANQAVTRKGSTSLGEVVVPEPDTTGIQPGQRRTLPAFATALW